MQSSMDQNSSTCKYLPSIDPIATIVVAQGNYPSVELRLPYNDLASIVAS
jgi:hypothetical protein